MSSVATTFPTATDITPINTPASGSTFEGLDHWLKNFQKYDSILAEMARASADNKFKDELATIEQWFTVLSGPERTASVYTLLQHSTQDQIRFFMAVLQQMIKAEEPTENIESTKPKNSKAGLRPPSINIPLPGSAAAPTPTSATKSQDPVTIPPGDNIKLNIRKPIPSRTPTSPLAFLSSQDGPLRTPGLDKSWASMVNTPLVPMFQKQDPSNSGVQGAVTNGSGIVQLGNVGNKGPGLAAISPTTLNLLATSGLSNDAQLLAVQLVMSGILQPVDTAVTTSKQEQATPPQSAARSHKKGNQGNWRSSPGTKHGNNSKNTMPKKTSAPKSSVSDSASTESSKTESFNPELLKDIPAWLRSLRLHKYIACFENMTWQEMVVLDDTILEKKGVAALGARRRLLRTFNQVQREMGMESSTAPPEASSGASSSSSPVRGPAQIVPQGATPTTKLSADSPSFTPTGQVSCSISPNVAPGPVITSAA